MQFIKNNIWFWIVWVSFFLLWVLIFPVWSSLVKLITLLLIIILIGLLWYLFLLRYSLRIFLIFFFSIFGLFVLYFSFPKKISNDYIAKEYVKQLEKYNWVNYVRWWENSIWIDCSWLIRKSLINTYFIVGFKYARIEFLWEWFVFWRYDMSAKAMSQENKYSFVVGRGESINSFDHANLQPWDFAVTANGVHVLAYLWNNQWIQASPNASKVIINSIPDENDPWLEQNVVFKRWKVLWNEYTWNSR